jgi:hypothetical protein
MKVQLKAVCDGSSFWSRQPGRIVDITDLEIGYIDDNEAFGELCAYFTPESWKTNWKTEHYGLIYSDEGWIKDFREQLKIIGFSEAAVNDVGYSEQGMQTDTYVCMDFGKDFYQEWKFNSTKELK